MSLYLAIYIFGLLDRKFSSRFDCLMMAPVAGADELLR